VRSLFLLSVLLFSCAFAGDPEPEIRSKVIKINNMNITLRYRVVNGQLEIIESQVISKDSFKSQ